MTSVSGPLQACFLPHPETMRVAATCGLDVYALVDSMLRCKCEQPLPISQGPLKGSTSTLDLLQAPEDVYRDTESAYAAALVLSHPPAHSLSRSLALLLLTSYRHSRMYTGTLDPPMRQHWYPLTLSLSLPLSLTLTFSQILDSSSCSP